MKKAGPAEPEELPLGRRLAWAALLGSAVLAWFLLIFGGADWITSRHDRRVRLHFDFDLQMPFVAAMVVPYLSLNVLLCLAPLCLTTRRQLVAFAVSLATATLLAAVGFLLLPAELVFPAPSQEQLGIWAGAYRVARRLALEHNLLPSLHVAFTILALVVYLPHVSRPAGWLIWLWCAAVVASTLLLHQHYLLDVLTGAVLGAAVARYVYEPLSERYGNSVKGCTTETRRHGEHI